MPVNQKVLCSLLHYLSVPASSPFKCCVRLGVQQPPHFDLTRLQQMLVESIAAPAAAVRFTGSLFEAKTLLLKLNSV